MTGIPKKYLIAGGWEVITEAVVKQINLKCDGVVFMLWGNKAIIKISHLVSSTVIRNGGNKWGRNKGGRIFLFH